jgi:hypothetical protein
MDCKNMKFIRYVIKKSSLNYFSFNRNVQKKIFEFFELFIGLIGLHEESSSSTNIRCSVV